MTTEAELLANLPADADGPLLFFRSKDDDNPELRILAVDGCSWGVLPGSKGAFGNWIKLGGPDWVREGFHADDWTEITPPPATPAPSLRDQRVAEGFGLGPRVRLFASATMHGQIYAVMPGRIGWKLQPDGDEWIEADKFPLDPDSYAESDWWTELPNPNTPALPDPSGDLPDGTRVRVTLEGVTQSWLREGGTVQYGDGDHYRALGRHGLTRAGATVEVLSLPTPPPSALQGAPGTLWRDPDHPDQLWRRVKLTECAVSLVLIEGKPVDGIVMLWLVGTYDEGDAILSRLVPAEVADHG